MSGPTAAHLVNQMRADAHQPGTAPAIALAAADILDVILHNWRTQSPEVFHSMTGRILRGELPSSARTDRSES